MKTILSIVLYHSQFAELQALLQSLVACKFIEQIVLIDNGGCDWAGKLNQPKITYIKSPKNGGFGYGHNLAIQQFAQDSEFFLICNPDIYIETCQLNKLIDIASARTEGLFSPTICHPDGKNQYGQRLLPTPTNLFTRRFLPRLAIQLDQTYLLKNVNIRQPCFVPACSGSFMLFRSQVLYELGGFDDRYFMYMEDFDLSRRCAVRFGNCYIPQVIAYHEHAQGSYKNKRLLKYHIESAVKYFNKWGWCYDKERQALNQKTLNQF